jgi:hypothetical protein
MAAAHPWLKTFVVIKAPTNHVQQSGPQEWALLETLTWYAALGSIIKVEELPCKFMNKASDRLVKNATLL